jgi:hypothetical protein
MLVFESAFLAEALQDELIVDSTPHISSGQEIELTGEVVRADEDTVTVAGKGLGITVKRSAVRLVTGHVGAKRTKAI